MKRTYQVVTKPSTLSSRELAEFLSKDGQLLLPLVELLERGEKAIDEVIDVMGRATVEAVLRMSAEQLAGPKRQGRRADDRALYWHGSQPGRVTLSERQLRVEKPRLRKKTARQGERGEVAIPAYDAMQRDQRLADRMLAIMLNGVSTRRYETVLPAMAEQVGIGKSEVSRETIEAGTRVLQDLAERDFSKVDVLIIYLDGIQFGNHHVLAAVGVDEDGKKYVLGVRSGASENATVTTALLERWISSLAGSAPTDVGCSSSMERRRYAARSPRCSAPATRYSAVASPHLGGAHRGTARSHAGRTEGRSRHARECADGLACRTRPRVDRQKKRSAHPNTIGLTSRRRAARGMWRRRPGIRPTSCFWTKPASPTICSDDSAAPRAERVSTTTPRRALAD